MPTLKFHCPDCSQKLEAEDEMLGTVIACPICGCDIRVPPDAPPVSAPAPTQSPLPTVNRQPGALILPVGWTCFAFGAITLALAAALKWPLPAPLFLAVGCGLGAMAIYRQRKVPGYALVICTMLLLPLSLVFVAHAFAARAQIRFATQAPRPTGPAPTPSPIPETPVQDEPPDDALKTRRYKPEPNAPRVLKSVDPPPVAAATTPGPMVDESPASTVPEPPAAPKRTFTASERRKIFDRFMEADERATREIEMANEDSDEKLNTRARADRQMQLSTGYKREIEQEYGLTPRQSRRILSEGIDGDLEEDW